MENLQEATYSMIGLLKEGWVKCQGISLGILQWRSVWVCACVYVFMCTCMYVSMYAHMCMSICVCVSVRVCECVWERHSHYKTGTCYADLSLMILRADMQYKKLRTGRHFSSIPVQTGNLCPSLKAARQEEFSYSLKGQFLHSVHS